MCKSWAVQQIKGALRGQKDPLPPPSKAAINQKLLRAARPPLTPDPGGCEIQARKTNRGRCRFCSGYFCAVCGCFAGAGAHPPGSPTLCSHRELNHYKPKESRSVWKSLCRPRWLCRRSLRGCGGPRAAGPGTGVPGLPFATGTFLCWGCGCPPSPALGTPDSQGVGPGPVSLLDLAPFDGSKLLQRS